MSTKKILCLVTAVILVVLIGSAFLPVYVNNDLDLSANVWDDILTDSMKIVYIIVLIVGIVGCLLYFFNVFKDYSLAYLPLGHCLYQSIDIIITYLDAESDILSLGVGAYIGLLLSIAGVVLVLLGNFVSDEPKKRPMNNYGYGGGNVNGPNGPNGPMGFDPRSGAPMYGQPSGYNPNQGPPMYR